MRAAVLGGEDYEWITSSERILRLGLLFGVLIVQATYTVRPTVHTTCTLPTLTPSLPQLSRMPTATLCTRRAQAGVTLYNLAYAPTLALTAPRVFTSYRLTRWPSHEAVGTRTGHHGAGTERHNARAPGCAAAHAVIIRTPCAARDRPLQPHRAPNPPPRHGPTPSVCDAVG